LVNANYRTTYTDSRTLFVVWYSKSYPLLMRCPVPHILIIAPVILNLPLTGVLFLSQHFHLMSPLHHITFYLLLCTCDHLHFDGGYSAIGSLPNTEYRYYAKTYSCSSNSNIVFIFTHLFHFNTNYRRISLPHCHVNCLFTVVPNTLLITLLFPI
jgi:hypothetical protein